MEIKPVLVIENSLNGLRLNESASAFKSDKIILEGIFTEFDVKNRNERIYTKDRFLPHLQELQERMSTLGVYGEFDHPDVFDTALSRVSHILESLTFNQSENRIDGSIRLLNTHYGKEAKALVMDGCPIFVSSRAAGVTESNGTVTVKKLFTYDAVADPGFASTKMNVKNLNESLGYTNESANFRIFDMSDESKMNELIEMNKNDEMVTKGQLVEYSDYLTGEIAKIKEEMNNNLKTGSNPDEFMKLSEYYESLMENYNKMSKYLDYLADTIQIVVNENKELKEKTDKIIEHNDYLAENLEKTINYSEYIAENLDKSINFSEYIAENLDKSIKYSEYLAENLDKSIDYAEYIAEHTEFNISNIETLSEYVDNSIKYTEYVAENVDNNIQYAEYLAEHLDNNIQYAEYLAEHVDNNIQYSEYIAENLSDTQAYSKYIAESLDKTIDMVKENRLNESDMFNDQRISDMKVNNVDKFYNDEDEFPPVNDQDLPNEIQDIEEEEEEEGQVQPVEGQIEEPVQPIEGLEEPVQPVEGQIEEPVQPELNLDILPGKNVTFNIDGEEKTGEVLSYNTQDGFVIVKVDDVVNVQEPVEGQEEGQVQPVQTQVQEIQVHESNIITVNDKLNEQEVKIKETITNLISEAKKRKALEENKPHFLLFLGESNQTLWNNLSVEDKERINVAMNESNYASEKEVLNIIRESLSEVKTKSEEDVLIEAIPDDLIEVWNGLNDTVKKSILTSAKFYPNLINSQAKMESFWNSRGLDKYSNPKQVLLKENKQYINDTKLSDNTVDKYLGIFKNLN